MQDYKKFEAEFYKTFETLKEIDFESNKLRKIIEIKETGNKAILNDLAEKLGIGSFFVLSSDEYLSKKSNTEKECENVKKNNTFVLGEIQKLKECLHQKLEECRKAKDEELKAKYHTLFTKLLNYATNR